MYYLYKKESPLGLKYLGFTKEKDPFVYPGSGLYWKRHLKKHNFGARDIATDILIETEDLDIIQFWGLYYSKLWNIVEDKSWANLMPENGKMGIEHTPEIRAKLSKANKGKIVSEETRQKLSVAHKGKKHTQEFKEFVGRLHKGNKYNLGRKASEKTKLKMSISQNAREWSEEILKEFSERMKGNKLGLGYKHTEESINKIKEAWNNPQHREKCAKTQFKKGQKSRTAIKVLDTKTGKIFESITEAAKEVGYCRTHLIEILNGKYENKTSLIKIK